MKIYDARENGGFGTFPAPVPCQASDECHGAGSQAAPPVSVGTLKGDLGNVTGQTCDADKLESKAKSDSRRASKLRRRAARLLRQGPAPAAAKLREQAKRLSQAATQAKNDAAKCSRGSRGRASEALGASGPSSSCARDLGGRDGRRRARPRDPADRILRSLDLLHPGGGHPDLQTKFTLGDPGEPEAAENVIVNLPPGLFGNPHAITTCTSGDFALAECPISSQAGVITVRANYSGDPNFMLGTAPVFDLEPRSNEETARFAFIVPVLNVPINIPVAVRTGGDYGLRMTVSGITQTMPLAAGDITIWGFPAADENNNEPFPEGQSRLAGGLPTERVGVVRVEFRCLASSGGDRRRAADRQPEQSAPASR